MYNILILTWILDVTVFGVERSFSEYALNQNVFDGNLPVQLSVNPLARVVFLGKGGLADLCIGNHLILKIEVFFDIYNIIGCYGGWGGVPAQCSRRGLSKICTHLERIWWKLIGYFLEKEGFTIYRSLHWWKPSHIEVLF